MLLAAGLREPQETGQHEGPGLFHKPGQVFTRSPSSWASDLPHPPAVFMSGLRLSQASWQISNDDGSGMEIKNILRVKEALGVPVSRSTNHRRAASPRGQRGSASASIFMAVVHHPLSPDCAPGGEGF